MKKPVSSNPSSRKDPLGLYAGFWTRLLLWLLKVLPAWFCLLIAPPIASVFYSMASPQRKALIANIRAIRPELKFLGLWWCGRRVFTQFALTYMDRLWNLHLGRPLRWRITDAEHLERQLSLPGGVLLITTHSGNYDIGAAFFAQSFKRDIHIVRVAEETKSLQEFRASELADVKRETPHVHVLYAGNNWSLGLAVSQLLASGAVVAVQGDRPLSGSALRLKHQDIFFHLPRGPFVLARMSRVPCYPISLYRIARCEYGVVTGPAIFEGNSRKTEEEIARAWLEWLCPVLKLHWDQWFVFEPLLERQSNVSIET